MKVYEEMSSCESSKQNKKNAKPFDAIEYN